MNMHRIISINELKDLLGVTSRVTLAYRAVAFGCDKLKS
jgi:hypothetical protein